LRGGMDFTQMSLRRSRNQLWPCRSKLAEALEKILKAELIRLNWPLEKTHDLQRLAKLLRERGSNLVGPAEPLANVLTEAYFSEHYPGFRSR
jgi:HEPN domain-containing protein